MVKAVVSRGEIRPLEPLPADWQEGQPLRVEKADDDEMPVEEIDRDFAVLAGLCAASEPADEDQLERRCAKRAARPRSRSVGKWGSNNAGLPARLQPFIRLAAQGFAGARANPPRSQGRASFHFLLPGSLRAGSWNSADPESRRQSSTAGPTFRRVRLWPLDTETTRLYGAVYVELPDRAAFCRKWT